MIKYLHSHYLNLAITKIKIPLFSGISRLKAIYWKIRLGKNCKFSGFPIFRNLPEAYINIGDECRFNSSHTSNLIGVYSPCMISTLKRGAHISVGNKCGFSGTVIGCALNITIGNNVKCGANTLITDTDWHSDDIRSGNDAPIKICDNVWLGYGVIVLKGVTIGENSIIGAGSIVTNDIPANVIAAGNPCKIIRKISNI